MWIVFVRTQFVTTQNDIGFARKKSTNNIICRAWVLKARPWSPDGS